jgi:hypothetical protein
MAGMKHFIWIPIALTLFAMLPATVSAQALPENPEPGKAAQAGWNRVRFLARDDEIVVDAFRGGTIRCRFNGATQDFLFCNPEYAYSSEQGYRFDRADVLNVRVSHETRNRRILIGLGAAAGGVFLGVRSLKTLDTGTSVFFGFLGAGVSGLMAWPVAAPVAHFLIPGESIFKQGPTDASPHAQSSQPQPAASPVQPSRLAP